MGAGADMAGERKGSGRGSSDGKPRARKTAPKKTNARGKKTASNYRFHDEPEREAAAKKRRATDKKHRTARAAAFKDFTAQLLRATALVLAVATFVVVVSIAQLVEGLPSMDELFASRHEPALTFYDVNGQKIATRGLTQGKNVRIDELPRHLPLAVLAVEDRRFYRHIGLDFIGLARAAATNLSAGEIRQGGSTITQQLAKNLFLSSDRTYKRKAEEALLALWLEHKLTKDEILALYLNRVYFGAGTYGIEAAAQRYFGKSAREVNVVEAAMLAGLLKAPSRYSPTNSIARADTRTAIVLDAMTTAGFISAEERADAPTTPARIVRASATPSAEYLLDWLVPQLTDYIEASSDDLIIETTIDLRLQRAAEVALAETLARAGEAKNVEEGAVVAMTPQGAIVALVGGRSYAVSGFNRATLSRRPPGSAFKPFVYFAALEAGYRPGDMLLDAPINIKGWQPTNYNRRFEGAISLRHALTHSTNTVAVRLAEAVGRERVIKTARRFGIASELKPVPSLALGSQGVGLLELTAAYAPFANGGLLATPYAVRRITTKGGELVYEHTPGTAPPVGEAKTIGQMNRLLAGVVTQGTGRAAAIAGHPTAGKTGTGQGYRDAWFVGYTAHMVAGAWVGNDAFTPMNKVTGGSLPAQIFSELMTIAHQGIAPLPLPGTQRPPEPEPTDDPLYDLLAEGLTGETDKPKAAASREERRFGGLLGAIARTLSGRPNSSVN